jgi:hypothetical protein
MDRRLSSVLVMALCFLAAPRISPGQDVTVSTTGLVTDPTARLVVATLRLEAFNATNAVNLGQPSTTVTSSMFMRITSAGRPRILQLALRFKW